jgi:endonuclease YncB( thermonuclease family)
MIRIALTILSILTASYAISAELHGTVVGVIDGDTITVLDASKQQHRIRINGIDAPESRQAFGERSKQNLSKFAFQKDARLECHKTDRYGRKVCKVWVQPGECSTCGKTLDVGHAQVLAGMAWWYREYAKEQTPEDQGRYESAEDEARLRKWGLWQEKEPVPPWEFRRKR